MSRLSSSSFPLSPPEPAMIGVPSSVVKRVNGLLYSVASSLVLVDRYLSGRMSGNGGYSNAEIMELLQVHPEMRRSASVASHTRTLLFPRVMCACHYLFSRKDQSAADQFLKQLISGACLEIDDPVYVLRERLVKNSISKAKLLPHYIMALVIKAWNCRRAGTSVKKLRYYEETEPFPTVI
jgi:hypothetical protein